MAKRVIFSVAGSGKTTYILNQLNLTENSLIITYTLNNLQNLRIGIIERFGFFPPNILLITYFSFIHSFCYQPFHINTYKTKGLNYAPNPNPYAKDDNRYIDKSRRLYSNRLAKFLFEKHTYDLINLRILKYFDNLYIDEVQDFAGHDFNFLMNILTIDINILLVGDFFQHTFDTSRDGNVNNSLHDNYEDYINRFERAHITIDTETLMRSYRCSPTICRFISSYIGIPIESHRTDETQINEVNDPIIAKDLIYDNSIVKLFYKEHYRYNCYSRNWGDSKGENKFSSVCVALNRTSYKSYLANTIHELPPQTRNKLYVACSRTWDNLIILSEDLFSPFKTLQ